MRKVYMRCTSKIPLDESIMTCMTTGCLVDVVQYDYPFNEITLSIIYTLVYTVTLLASWKIDEARCTSW